MVGIENHYISFPHVPRFDGVQFHNSTLFFVMSHIHQEPIFQPHDWSIKFLWSKTIRQLLLVIWWIKQLPRLKISLQPKWKWRKLPELRTQRDALWVLIRHNLILGQQCEANKLVIATCCCLRSPQQTLSSSLCISPRTSPHQTC